MYSLAAHSIRLTQSLFLTWLMWKGKQKRIKSRVLRCTNTLESWTEVLTASTWVKTKTCIHVAGDGGSNDISSSTGFDFYFDIKQ